MTGPALIAALEGGGTTFLLTVALLRHHHDVDNNLPNTDFEILYKESIHTTTPSETLEKASQFFRKHCPGQGYDALGICTFGPVGVNPNLPSYGKILPGSPKKEWRNVDILNPILSACSSKDGSRKPVFKVDTDVNAPALAEYTYRCEILKQEINSLAYITVGTGVGVGLVVNGKPVHGMMHPEGGHVPIVPLEMIEGFAYSWGANCPFNGKNTVEGTASSVALTELLGQECDSNSGLQRDSLKNLDDDHVIWDHAANSLACLCVTLCLVTSVEGIVFGGGVMNRKVLFDKIRRRTKEILNGYLDLSQVNTSEGLEEYICPSVWCDTEVGPGIVGALVLAKFALQNRSEKKETPLENGCDPLPNMKSETKKMCNFKFLSGVMVGSALGMVLSSMCLRVIRK